MRGRRDRLFEDLVDGGVAPGAAGGSGPSRGANRVSNGGLTTDSGGGGTGNLEDSCSLKDRLKMYLEQRRGILVWGIDHFRSADISTNKKIQVSFYFANAYFIKSLAFGSVG